MEGIGEHELYAHDGRRQCHIQCMMVFQYIVRIGGTVRGNHTGSVRVEGKGKGKEEQIRLEAERTPLVGANLGAIGVEKEAPELGRREP